MIQVHPFSLVLSVAAQRAQTPKQAAHVRRWQGAIRSLERAFAAPSSDR
jgi:hypothetical protein